MTAAQDGPGPQRLLLVSFVSLPVRPGLPPTPVLGHVALSTKPSQEQMAVPRPCVRSLCLSHGNGGDGRTDVPQAGLAGQSGLEATSTPGAWTNNFWPAPLPLRASALLSLVHPPPIKPTSVFSRHPSF